MKLVSVVIPVYNMGNYINRCVGSFIEQSYYNIEIILVDDGSKDDSFNHCKELAKKDSRIRVYHTENRGSGPARNYGIEHAKGDYIYFPDADDYVSKNTISILIKAAEDCDLVVFGYKNVDFNGSVKSIKEYPDLVRMGDEIRSNYSEYMTTNSSLGIQGAPWNKLFNLKLIREKGILFPALRRHQDEGFIASYMTFVDKVHFIPDVLYTYLTNDLTKEWDKYPVNYIDAVIGLFYTRKTNILIWNKADSVTHNMVYREYVCNFIKALELSFSPKFGFGMKRRWLWIMVQRERLEDVYVTSMIDPYHKLAYKLLRCGSMFLYPVLWIKVMIEKSGFKKYLKKNK